MKKKIVLILILILPFGFGFSQENKFKVREIQVISDSLYYGYKESNYKEKDYNKLQKFRNQIVIQHTDTASTSYKIALSKKYAADGLYLRYSMNLEEAISSSKRALRLALNLENRNLYYEGHIHLSLFDQYGDFGDKIKSLYHAKKAKEVFSDTLVYNHEKLAKAEFSIGYATSRFKNHMLEIEHYKKAINLTISRKGEYNQQAAFYEHHLALVYGFLGYTTKELKSYEKVIKRWEAIESNIMDMSYLSIAYGSIATCYSLHGDFDMAEKYLIKKENLVNKYHGHTTKWFNETFKGRTQVHLWYSRANLALHQNDTLTALYYNTKIIDFVDNFDFNDPNNNPQNLSYAYNFVRLNKLHALSFRADIIKQNEPFRAIKLFSEALAVESKANHSLPTLKIKLNLSELYKNNKEYTIIKDKLNEWITTANEKKVTNDQLFLLAEKANLERLLGHSESMDNLYISVFKKVQLDTLKAIPLETLTFKQCKTISSQQYISQILKASKDYQKVYSKTNQKRPLKIAHNLSLLASDIFSDSYLFTESNNNTHQIRTSINEQLLSTSIQLKNDHILDNIVSKIEDSNSQIHWKKFLSSNQKKHLNIPDSILELESDLKNELHFYRKKIIADNDYDSEANRVKKEKIFNIEKKLQDLELSYQKNYPSYYNQTQKSFDLVFLKKQLHEKQTLLKYIFADTNVYAFEITSNSTRLYKIGKKNKLSNQIEIFTESLSNPNTKNQDLATELYKALLVPKGIMLASNQELVMVLDDVLNYLPFEGLVNTKGEYLAEKFNISYASSMALWSEQLRSKESKFKKMGVFAPTYGSQIVQNAKRNDSTFLIGAEKESLNISRLFSSDTYLGNNASKEAFIENASQYGILHLAMHSTINNTNSKFSNLSFSPNKKDNKLFVSELYNIPLNADLAVLSACNTGSGILKNGEGIQSISRAFTYAGVASTVTSLWSVPDKETAQIMVSFYSYLKKGKSKNKALQLAKLDYLASTDDASLKHPYYWAGFVISGNTAPITQPNNSLIYMGVSAILLLFPIFFFRKKLTTL